MIDEIPARWIFERSSGYAGYRCSGCSAWIYNNEELKCKCDDEREEFMKLLKRCYSPSISIPDSVDSFGKFDDWLQLTKKEDK